MPCFPLAGNSGRQRRPHKGLHGFCNPVTKPQFRGCSNFNLADLGVANFTANLAGYSAMYVVLCVRLGGDTMAKRRPSGEGMIRLKKKKWEGSYSPKLPNGKRKKFNIYADTREECEEKLAEMVEQKNAEIAAEKERLKSGRMVS